MELKNGNVDVKYFDVNLEAHVPLSVENNRVNYEVCKELKDYSIVKLYVSNTGINDDIEPTLLEGLYDCYNTKEECLNNAYCSSAIEVYTLMNNKSGELEDCEPSLYIDDILTAYYIRYAPILETTKEGYEVVDIDEKLGVKIARAYAIGSVINNGFYIRSIYPCELHDSLIGIAAMDISETSFNKNGDWFSNTRYMYERLMDNYMYHRYFDKDRNEIKEGDTLVFEGFSDYAEDNYVDFYDHYYEYGYLDSYKEGDTIEVKSVDNNLAVLVDGRYHDLNALQLLKWKIA